MLYFPNGQEIFNCLFGIIANPSQCIERQQQNNDYYKVTLNVNIRQEWWRPQPAELNLFWGAFACGWWRLYTTRCLHRLHLERGKGKPWKPKMLLCVESPLRIFQIPFNVARITMRWFLSLPVHLIWTSQGTASTWFVAKFLTRHEYNGTMIFLSPVALNAF